MKLILLYANMSALVATFRRCWEGRLHGSFYGCFEDSGTSDDKA